MGNVSASNLKVFSNGIVKIGMILVLFYHTIYLFKYLLFSFAINSSIFVGDFSNSKLVYNSTSSEKVLLST